VLTEIRSNKYTVQPVAVKHGGGGHAKACGATLKDRDEAMELLEELNAYNKE
jgi:phosphoesterase RecJ-like protein